MGRESWHHLYKTAWWQRIREEQLRKHPMCQCPHCQDRSRVATMVDHIQPHQGNRRLFFDRRNLQSMARECHDKYKQSQERGGAGFDQGCDEHGFPLNGEHFWYSEEAN